MLCGTTSRCLCGLVCPSRTSVCVEVFGYDCGLSCVISLKVFELTESGKTKSLGNSIFPKVKLAPGPRATELRQPSEKKNPTP